MYDTFTVMYYNTTTLATKSSFTTEVKESCVAYTLRSQVYSVFIASSDSFRVIELTQRNASELSYYL